MSTPYVELHARSAFSFLRGACVPEDYAQRCTGLNQAGMALLDINGVYGSPRFHQAMTKAGHAPHLGAEHLYRWSPLSLADRQSTRIPEPLPDDFADEAADKQTSQARGGAAATPEELAEFSEGLV